MAGTNDFRELIEGYKSLPEDHTVEVIVAFGGADKDGWRGMKFADMDQIIDDARDNRFGNETASDAYLYQDDRANMDDEDSLKLFLDHIKDEYTNFDRRFLTFWDHGNSYKGFGGDSNFNRDQLYMDEIARAFQRSQPGVFDLIGFDACLMASVEVAKVVQPHAKYMIASEETEPGHGWLWSEVIQIYAWEDSIVEAGKQMVDNFVQDVHGSEDKGKTLSLLDLSRYDELAAALDPVVAMLDRQFDSNDDYSGDVASSITRAGAFGKSEKADPRASMDLRHFAQLLSDEFADTEISPNLEDLVTEIDLFVVHSNHDGSRPHAYGVSIAAPEDIEPWYSDYKVNDTWLQFQDAYSRWRQGDTTSPVVVESDVAETLEVTFSDDYPIDVTTMYGFVEPVEYDDGSVDDVFMVVAEEPAYLYDTGGEYTYYAEPWSGWWFTVQYDPGEITAWIPASFVGYGEDEYGQYDIYTAEIDYYWGGGEYPEYAVLTLFVDETGVFDHSIQTYQYIYSGPDDEVGTVRFDKATYWIEPGDAVQFWNYGFSLSDVTLDDWYEASDVITFVQAPVFQLEYLEFVDEFGQPVQYVYAMWAEDVGGNGVLTDLYPVTP